MRSRVTSATATVRSLAGSSHRSGQDERAYASSRKPASGDLSPIVLSALNVLLFLPLLCQAQEAPLEAGMDLIDVSIVMTAPADTYSKGSIENIFRNALESQQITHESLTVERIQSYSDYITLRRMIEDPQGFLKISGSPVVYFVDDNQEDGGTKAFVVHESDPAKPVSGISVQVQDGGQLTISEWPLEASETKAVFRVKSAETGDYLFTPDPTLDIHSYQLMYGSQSVTGDWLPWPGRRARFSLDIRGFPAATETFAALKSHLENRRNKVEFTGESSSVMSLVDAGFSGGVVGQPAKLSNGVLSCESPTYDADRIWYLVAVTPAQRDAVVKWIQDGIKSDTLNEFKLAEMLKAGKALADFPIVPPSEARELDGRQGPAWFELEKAEDQFVMSLDVVNVGDWRRRFAQPGSTTPLPGLSLAVFEKNGELIRFEKGEFWLTEDLKDWNGGSGM